MFFGKSKPEKNLTDNQERQPAPQLPQFEGEFLSRLLLVIDGSHHSRQDAEFAFKMAISLNCQLAVAFIIDTATLDYLLQMRIFIEEERADMEAALEMKGQRYLDMIKEAATKYNLPIDTFIVRGRQHQAVLQLAREYHASAIVIGGWTRENRQKDLSSVERQLILDLTECPVFVVKDGSNSERL